MTTLTNYQYHSHYFEAFILSLQNFHRLKIVLCCYASFSYIAWQDLKALAGTI